MKIQQFSQIGKRSNNEDGLGTSAVLISVWNLAILRQRKAITERLQSYMFANG